ncbi:MAG: hypothetical protein WC980_05590 [Candidatus Brocadiia bacterium]
MSNKKMQNCLTEILKVGNLFIWSGIGGILVLVVLLLAHEEIPIFYYILVAILLLQGIGLITYRKWARISGIIILLTLSVAIITPLFLSLKYSDFDDIKGIICLLVAIPITVYSVIILWRKDTKRIFNAKGYIEGLDD